MNDRLVIRGAREHNLRNIDLDLPKDSLVVISGLSGSGKSSLARFIRFMLYGFTSPRNSSVAQNDKKKYTPWDESVCKGESQHGYHREQAFRL